MFSYDVKELFGFSLSFRIPQPDLLSDGFCYGLPDGGQAGLSKILKVEIYRDVNNVFVHYKMKDFVNTTSEKPSLESNLHYLFKEVMCQSLSEEGYEIYIEPDISPLDRLCWSRYRPDLLGVTYNQTHFFIVLVECETRPSYSNIKRKSSKIRKWFTFQKRLDENHNIRLLLVIPPGNLRRINKGYIRELWEIWIINKKGTIIHKIPKIIS